METLTDLRLACCLRSQSPSRLCWILIGVQINTHQRRDDTPGNDQHRGRSTLPHASRLSLNAPRRRHVMSRNHKSQLQPQLKRQVHHRSGRQVPRTAEQLGHIRGFASHTPSEFGARHLLFSHQFLDLMKKILDKIFTSEQALKIRVIQLVIKPSTDLNIFHDFFPLLKEFSMILARASYSFRISLALPTWPGSTLFSFLPPKPKSKTCRPDRAGT